MKKLISRYVLIGGLILGMSAFSPCRSYAADIESPQSTEIVESGSEDMAGGSSDMTDAEEDITSSEDADAEEDVNTSEEADTQEDIISPEEADVVEDVTSPEEADAVEDAASPEEADAEENVINSEEADAEKDVTNPEEADAEEDVTSPEEADAEENVTSPEGADVEEDVTNPEEADVGEDVNVSDDAVGKEDISNYEKAEVEDDDSLVLDTDYDVSKSDKAYVNDAAVISEEKAEKIEEEQAGLPEKAEDKNSFSVTDKTLLSSEKAVVKTDAKAAVQESVVTIMAPAAPVLLFDKENTAKVNPASKALRTIADGIYVIGAKKDSFMTLTVSKSKKASKANVLLKKSNGGDLQKFKVVYNEKKGYYTIINVQTGKAIALAKNSDENSISIVQKKATGGKMQRWAIIEKDGYFKIISLVTGKAVDINRNSMKNKTKIQQFTENEGDAQLFRFIKSGKAVVFKDGVYTISPKMNTKKVLKVKKNSMKNGGNVVVSEKKSLDSQKFIITDMKDGTYKITNYYSGKVIKAADDSKKAGTNVNQDTMKADLTERWYIVDAGDGTVYFQNAATKLCIDIAGDKAKSSANIQTDTKTGADDQRYFLRKAGITKVKDGYYIIKSSADESKVLETGFDSKQVGARIMLNEKDDGDNQKYKITYLKNGYYRITNAGSSHSLHVMNSALDKQSDIIQYKETDAYSQFWIIHINKDKSVSFINANSGMVIGLNKEKTDDGTMAVQTNYNKKKTTQKFKLSKADFTPDKNMKIDYTMVDPMQYKGYKNGWLKKNAVWYFFEKDGKLTVKQTEAPRIASVPGFYVSPMKTGNLNPKSERIEAMIERAYEYLGDPYIVYKSTAPGNGVDCSGLVMQCLYAAGFDPYPATPARHSWEEYTSRTLFHETPMKHVNYSDRKRGDLIYYKSANSGLINHVAIYLGNGRIIESWPPNVTDYYGVTDYPHTIIYGVTRPIE